MKCFSFSITTSMYKSVVVPICSSNMVLIIIIQLHLCTSKFSHASHIIPVLCDLEFRCMWYYDMSQSRGEPCHQCPVWGGWGIGDSFHLIFPALLSTVNKEQQGKVAPIKKWNIISKLLTCQHLWNFCNKDVIANFTHFFPPWFTWQRKVKGGWSLLRPICPCCMFCWNSLK